MYNLKYLIGGAALVLATSALAGGPEPAPVPVDNSGFYVGINGGVNFLARDDRDMFWTFNNINTNIGRNAYDTFGWNVAAAIGYRFNAFRVEVEGAYLQHDAENNNRNLVINNLGTWNSNTLDVVTVLLNGYYDFDMGNGFVPYVGLGLGWGQASTNFRVFNNFVVANNFRVNLDNDGFAFQGVLGVDYKVSDNVRVGLSYHAVGIATDNNNNRFINVGNNAFNINRDFGFENKINLGLTYMF